MTNPPPPQTCIIEALWTGNTHWEVVLQGFNYYNYYNYSLLLWGMVVVFERLGPRAEREIMAEACSRDHEKCLT